MENNDNGILNVVGYARVSSDSQVDNTSIAEQKRRIQAQCDAKGWNLLEVFVDEGYSGSTTDRPAYTAMMEFLQANKENVQGFMVWKMDRAHRNQLNLLKFIKVELAEMNIDFISITESFDTSTAVGRMMLGILSTFGEFERETINERTRGGRTAKARENKFAGGQVPYGYTLVNGQVEIEKEQALIVKEVFQLYLEGKSYNRIATMLDKRQVPTKKGGKWQAQHIKQMVNNESYTGINVYNGPKEKNAIRQTDVFPRIISRQLWNKVHFQLKKNTLKGA